MPVGPGQNLLHYRVVEKIGEGGMGVVWKALDTTLDREVAIKVLPEQLTQESERLARFEREAKLLASLNHPNIAAVYGMHQAKTSEGPGQAVHFLAMELVPGEDLAQRLARGPLASEDALEVATQVAEALSSAHDRGVVHRDLKPANVKRTPEGKIKVLDFGLAKALSPESASGSGTSPSMSPTITSAGTVAGMILGTAAYMSPEQARGKPVDRRADVWAFGCLLYEMLTGKPAFPGDTITDVLAAVVTRDPDWATLPESTSAGVRGLLRRCLNKDVAGRLRDIGDSRIFLEDDGPVALAGDAGPDAVRPSAGRRLLPWLVAAVMAALALAGWVTRPKDSGIAGAGVTNHLAVRLPEEIKLNNEANVAEFQILALSPDGTTIAFVGTGGTVHSGTALYVRRLDAPDVKMLPGTEDASSPFFSPDGRWIGFFADGFLKKVAVAGGSPIQLCEVGLNRSGTWGPDDTIVFSPSSGSPLMKIPSGGGTPEPLTRLDEEGSERTHRWPVFLPSRNEVVFTIGTRGKPGDYEEADIGIVSLDSGERRTLLRGASMVRATASGHLLLGREGQILAMPLAEADGGAAANAVPVVDEVDGIPSSGVLYFDVAPNGTLVYAERNPGATQFEPIWVTRKGEIERLDLPPREYRMPRISPDGTRVAFGVGPGRGRTSDIWIHDLRTGSMTRLTFDSRSAVPAWNSDGTRVSFNLMGSETDSLSWKAADGSDTTTSLVGFDSSIPRGPLGWSPGDALLLYQEEGGNSNDLRVFDPADGSTRPFVATPAIELGGALSRDGRWVAYASDESGTIEIYVEAFPDKGGRWQVSNGGIAPRWSADGSELYYTLGTRMMAVAVRTEPTFSHGIARELFEMPFLTTSEVYANYDVTPDGRFLLIRSTARDTTSRHLNVVLDWFDELNRAAPLD